MLYLLDDSDDRVVEEIENRLMEMGSKVVPLLEKAWPEDTSPKRVERILKLIKEINSRVLTEEMKEWRDSEEQDLLEGVLIIDKLHNPIQDRQVIENKLDKIKLDAWLELKYDLTSFEKVKILNYVFFDMHQFKGDTEHYHSSKNSFISHVLDTRMGNPVSLAVIYSIIAQRLNIPVYGVNLPQHFILGYLKDFEWELIQRFNDEPILSNEEGGDVLFYINPFNSGLIFSRENIIQFLDQLKLEPKDSYFRICSNEEIIKRILRNLATSFQKENNEPKLQIVQQMMALFQK